MAFRVPDNSLFAMLSRSPWWYSALIGLALIALSLVIAGGQYVIIGLFSSLPFFAIAGYAGRTQLNKPSRQRVAEVDELARKMSAEEIASKIAASYVKARYDAIEFKGAAADLELTRGNRTFLLSTNRCRVANTGVDALKKLVEAGKSVEATGFLYVALGEISSAASQFAKQHDIELIQSDRLAAFFDGKVQIN